MKEQRFYSGWSAGRKRICRLFCAGIFGLVCGAALCGFSVAASSESFPSYVEIPARGNYTIGEDAETIYEDGTATTGTEFYLRIENEADSNSPGVEDDLPSGGGSTGEDIGTGIVIPENPGTGIEVPVTPDPADTTPGVTPGVSESEEPYTGSSQPVTSGTDYVDGALPKTGDYGMDSRVLLLAALVFGTGYLTCDYYEKRYEKKTV
jgi:hypothetical protein